MVEISMKKSKYPLKGFIDTHLHTAPDIKPRLISDIEAALQAKNEQMMGIVVKSHVEPTSGRAALASQVTGLMVWGGVCLNQSVGGLNIQAVNTAAMMGGKVVWFPTTSRDQIKLNRDQKTEELLEEILTIILENEMVLATGHLKVEDTFHILDLAQSMGLSKVMVNHPLTQVVGASLEEQKEMSRTAFLEHCYVACLPGHDQLDPERIIQSIKEIGAERCIMATDLGQFQNPEPVLGFKTYIKHLMDSGISWKEIFQMCHINPSQLFL
jgi:hypothetical protein